MKKFKDEFEKYYDKIKTHDPTSLVVSQLVDTDIKENAAHIVSNHQYFDG